MIRGTGIAGLAGIPRLRPLSATVSLIRPLLAVRRGDVLCYLDSIGQDYRIDASNADPRFTRNRLRGDLLPTLRSQYNAEVDEAIMRLAVQADESQQLISMLALGLHERSMASSSTGITIDCTALAGEPPLLIREACKIAWTTAGWPLQNMGFDHWHQLARLIAQKADRSSLNLPGGLRAQRHCDRVDISRST